MWGWPGFMIEDYQKREEEREASCAIVKSEIFSEDWYVKSVTLWWKWKNETWEVRFSDGNGRFFSGQSRCAADLMEAGVEDDWAVRGENITQVVIRTNIGTNIWTNIRDNIEKNIGTNVWTNIGTNMWTNIGTNIWTNNGTNIRTNIRPNIGTNIWTNIRTNIRTNITTNIGTNIYRDQYWKQHGPIVEPILVQYSFLTFQFQLWLPKVTVT